MPAMALSKASGGTVGWRRTSMKASIVRPTRSRSTRAVKPVITPARVSRRTRSAAPCGLSPTRSPSLAKDVLPFRTSSSTIRKSVASNTTCSTTIAPSKSKSNGEIRIIPPMTTIGVPTEIKRDEYRVALTPASVRELVERGHEVLVQAGAGEGSAISDDDYRAQGARIMPDAEAVFREAEMIVKVKEPQSV